MSLVFCHGADDGIVGEHYPLISGVVTASAGTGRGGTKSLRLTTNNGYVGRRLAAEEKHATLIVGGWLDLSNYYGDCETLIGFAGDANATRHITIRATAGTIEIRRGGNTGTLLASATFIPGYVWGTEPAPMYIEAKVTLDDVSGYVEVRKDGAMLTSYTGDTRNGGTEAVLDTVIWGAHDNGPNETDWDDMYICNGAGSVNNDFLGAIQVATVLPDAAGSRSEWTGSDGNSVDNHLLVDEATPSATDYVLGDAEGETDLYGFAASGAVGTVKGVMVTAVAVKQGADDAALNLVAKHGATEALSAERAVTGTAQALSGVFENNPATGAAWTVAEVDAAEFGIAVANPAD